MSRPYFTLVVRDDVCSPWRIEFGDYSRPVVREEQRDWLDDYDGSGEFRSPSNARIIQSGDTPAEQNAAVAELNRRDA